MINHIRGTAARNRRQLSQKLGQMNRMHGPSAFVLPASRRGIFGKIFNKKVGGCDRLEDVFHVFRDKIQDDLPKIEAIAKNEAASAQFQLNTLINCQKIEVIDKFFYDEILQAIENRLDSIHEAKDLVRIGIGLGMNSKFAEDHVGLIKKFYDHCFLNRYLLSLNDRHTLNQIFQAMDAPKICGRHLDIFKEVRRQEAQKLAFSSLFGGVTPPEHISLSFDFENKVVLILNKESQQTIILCGT